MGVPSRSGGLTGSRFRMSRRRGSRTWLETWSAEFVLGLTSTSCRGGGKGSVAVVRVAPISTPPCITNGTVYERLPGKTQTVRDPLRLADLFSRGDAARANAQARSARARANAQARADRAARTIL